MEKNRLKVKEKFSFHALAHKLKTLALIAGFSFDLYILPPINTGKFWWVGPIYIILILICIFLRQIFRRFINYGTFYFFYNFHNLFYNLFSFLASFFLGSLLAYSLIYYSSLSDIFSVWPILILILLAIILNEILKDKIFDVAIFMLAINFYFILNTPIFIKEVSNSSFYLAIILAFLVNILILKIIKWIYYEAAHQMLYLIFLFFIPVVISGLYFLKYFPAVPLKLGETGFYSYVEKVKTESGLEYYKEEKGKSKKEKYYFWQDIYINKNSLKNNELYFFSSVIAPKNAEIKSLVTHNWEKYNLKNKNWEEKFMFKFSIYGDKLDGYRGYSLKENISTGEWRVRVLADQRVIGIKKVFIN